MYAWLVLLPSVNIAQNKPSTYIGTNLSRGTELRVLRLAVSCRGEYTQSVEGNSDAQKVEEVLRIMKAWIAEINDIYGREYSVRFELVPDQLLRTLIFTNPNNDPWPDMEGAGCDGAGKIHDIQGKVIDGLIGADKYDFSHVVLGNFNGGCAGGFKGGHSGGFDIGVTRHEMGHQFQQGHTISNGGNNNYEPENAGKSIQGGNSEPHAHAYSFHQLALHLLNSEPNTGRNVPTNNHVPSVNAGLDRAIPIGTPFMLTGVAEDEDEGDRITYVWDQMDMGIAKNLPNPNDVEGAIFSRLVPTYNASRVFPMIDSLIANRFSSTLEQLPMHPRELNFRLTVNDNHMFNYQGTMVKASGINSDDVKITVVDNGGAFKVSSQQNAETYVGGSTQTITWNVSGTDKAPINTKNVKITMSNDGGKTFPIVLLNSTPNNGKAEVVLPNINTKLARIKVEAVDNYYFAINNQNFTVNQNTAKQGIRIFTSTPTLLVDEVEYRATYKIALLSKPSAPVEISLKTNDQAEISTDGLHFTNQIVLTLKDTTAVTITVLGTEDALMEGLHTDVIEHWVSNSGDPNNYPQGMIGEPIGVRISDAQMPAIVGIDFDNESSTDVPTNWIKISDIRNQTIKNIQTDSGIPSDISLTTSASDCGIGGCSFEYGFYSDLPKHWQSLFSIRGIAIARGTVTFTWSGLEPNTEYRVLVFGLNTFGELDQNVTIKGGGSPITFNQKGKQVTLYINEKESSNGMLMDFTKKITSTAEGTITIIVNPNTDRNADHKEVSFAGLGICK